MGKTGRRMDRQQKRGVGGAGRRPPGSWPRAQVAASLVSGPLTAHRVFSGPRGAAVWEEAGSVGTF